MPDQLEDPPQRPHRPGLLGLALDAITALTQLARRFLMADQTTTPDREFHYIITLARSNRTGGTDTHTINGIYTSTETRRDALLEGVLSHAKQRLGIPPSQPYGVLFYSLEPLRITDPAPDATPHRIPPPGGAGEAKAR
ncbi:hypothetical protein [Nocardia abscessus]|uniref:hypothetical protein n=1 Tax=Nocardia abscessus TaxID=120957 RepID=UPI00245437CB|nr:hypothetical protein [Nocardia abscessus]